MSLVFSRPVGTVVSKVDIFPAPGEFTPWEEGRYQVILISYAKEVKEASLS